MAAAGTARGRGPLGEQTHGVRASAQAPGTAFAGSWHWRLPRDPGGASFLKRKGSPFLPYYNFSFPWFLYIFIPFKMRPHA